jgi:D-3-phosphoglycerate dehydrogenase
VVAFDPGLSPAAIRADGVEVAADLDDLLRAADVLSLHVPLTPETRHLIGARELALMRPRTALVNVSRGGVVDEAALADALVRGHLRCAAVDVFAEEPPAADHPLLGLPNALCTPHLGAATSEALIRMGMCAAAAALDVLGGRWPPHPVNPQVIPRAPLSVAPKST